LPCVTDMFPSILENKETKFNSEMSCAERAEVSPQNIFVNTMAAQLLMLYLRKIITNDGLKSFCTTFSIDSINTRTLFNSFTNIDKIIKEVHG